MRLRLLAALSLLLALPAPPGHATAPRPRHRAVYHVPGRVTLGEAPVEERLDRAYEALAVTPITKDVLRRYDMQAYLGDSGDETRIAVPYAIPDIDGDKVGDVLLYDTSFVLVDYKPVGDATITTFSGRDGRRLWSKAFDQPLPGVGVAPVGASGRAGVVVVNVWFDESDDLVYRFAGYTGKGDRVYDRTVTPADGLGDVEFGGFFDAVPRGGTDLLVARIKRLAAVNASVNGFNGPSVDVSQVFVLDGGNGKYAAVTEQQVGVGGRTSFLVTGDIDQDKRDDYLQVRLGVRQRGTVVARSTVEDRTIWRNDDVPVGWASWVGGTADMAGTSARDVLFGTWLDGAPLLHVDGVTDDMPLLDGDPNGIHGILLDGADGSVTWDRVDGELAFYWPFADLDHDRKVEVMSASMVRRDDKVGLGFLLVDGRNKVRARREVLVSPDVPGIASMGAYIGSAGDVDADGVPDLTYSVQAGTTSITTKSADGFLLGRTFATLATRDYPLIDTLDGHGDDRLGWTTSKDTRRASFRDGRTGASYWDLTVTTPLSVGLSALERGRRGRCADLLVVAVGSKEQAGDVWVARLDGTDGRTRWTRNLLGHPKAPVLKRLGGRSSRCG